MPSKIIIAAAGSGKTELITQSALASSKSLLIVTYTNENMGVIRERIIKAVGYIPSHIKLLSWFSFLLKETIRPYQNFLYGGRRVSTLNFEPIPESLKYVPEINTHAYYFTKSGKMYKDRVSGFAYKTCEKSRGLTIKRLEKIYDEIYVDEVQDLAGWDLEILELLMASKINLTFVGDIRQATYTTNYSSKNKQFKGAGIIKWFQEREKRNMCNVEFKTESYRCNQHICDFADNLYPNLSKTTSLNNTVTGHDGVFLLKGENVPSYFKKFSPQVLRHNRNSQAYGSSPINFGQAKGQTFDRILIYPTDPIKHYLQTGQLFKMKSQKQSAAFDIPKFYVAVTRARHSVAIVTDNASCFDTLKHYCE